jgi:hypothetical protein
MTYRNRKRRYLNNPPRRGVRQAQPDFAALDAMLESIVRVIAWSCRLVAWGVTKLLGRPRKVVDPEVSRRVAAALQQMPASPGRPAPHRSGVTPVAQPPARPPAMPASPAPVARAAQRPWHEFSRRTYSRAAGVLTKGERAFDAPLMLAVRNRYRVFYKVRLSDVVKCPEGNLGDYEFFEAIRGFHVDFVLCDHATTAPLLVIELDDRSHASDRSARRDTVKDQVLRVAGVPILRVPAQQAYDPLQLGVLIEQRLPSDSAGGRAD